MGQAHINGTMNRHMIYGTIFGKKYESKYANEQKKIEVFHLKIYMLIQNMNKKGIWGIYIGIWNLSTPSI